jgi:hypothetical protein
MNDEEVKKTVAKSCATRLVNDKDLGWKLHLSGVSRECRDTLTELVQKLGPYNKEVLQKRIVTDTVEAEKALKALGDEKIIRRQSSTFSSSHATCVGLRPLNTSCMRCWVDRRRFAVEVSGHEVEP